MKIKYLIKKEINLWKVMIKIFSQLKIKMKMKAKTRMHTMIRMVHKINLVKKELLKPSCKITENLNVKRK